MTGSTHMGAGAAVALALSPIGGFVSVFVAVSGGVLGGLLPDLDIRHSTGSTEVRRIVLSLVVLLVALGIAGYATGADLIAQLVSALMGISIGFTQLVGVAMVAASCMLGRSTGHRGFLHSALACAVTSFGVWLVWVPLAWPFALGFVSHLVLDLLNAKGERLLWPLRTGFALGLCGSEGMVNATLGIVSHVLVVLLAIVRLGLASMPLMGA